MKSEQVSNHSWVYFCDVSASIYAQEDKHEPKEKENKPN